MVGLPKELEIARHRDEFEGKLITWGAKTRFAEHLMDYASRMKSLGIRFLVAGIFVFVLGVFVGALRLVWLGDTLQVAGAVVYGCGLSHLLCARAFYRQARGIAQQLATETRRELDYVKKLVAEKESATTPP